MIHSAKDKKRQLVTLKLKRREFVRDKGNGRHGRRKIEFKKAEGDTGAGSR